MYQVLLVLLFILSDDFTMMYKYLLVLIIVICIVYEINCQSDVYLKRLKKESNLKVFDNGPGVSGFPIQFTAYFPSRVFQSYQFDFVDVDNPSNFVSVVGRDSVTAELTFYTNNTNEHREIRVTLWLQIVGVPFIRIEEVTHAFTVSHSLSGSVQYSQANASKTALEGSYVIANEPFGLEFILHDPLHNFDHFNKSYSWLIDNTALPDNSPNVSFSIATSGNHSVSVNVTMLTENDERSLSLDTWVFIQDRLNASSVDLVGKTFILRNESLSLTINCSKISSKSGPFHYCTFLRNSTADNSTSLDCPATATHFITNKCLFSYSHYFHSAGKYQLIMQLWNEVSNWSQKYEITVMPITPVSALSFVVIPVLSVILVVMILTMSVAVHLQQRKRYTVEVADFDFRPEISDEDLVEKTFIQRLKDSYREEVANGLWYCCSPSRQHLLGVNNDTESINDLGYASTSVQT